MSTKQDLEWAEAAWKATLRRCLISLAAQLERDALDLRGAATQPKSR